MVSHPDANHLQYTANHRKHQIRLQFSFRSHKTHNCFEEIQSDINSWFTVVVCDEKGSFEYEPESLVICMTEAVVPYDFISDETDEAVINEYYKALVVMCRTNLIKVWNDEGCPDRLAYEKTPLSQITFLENVCDIDKITINKIKEASKATAGVVITDSISNDKDNGVIAAPFFTSEKGDILTKQSGDGIGLSLNFAFVKAQEGLDFAEILQYFYGDVRLSVF